MLGRRRCGIGYQAMVAGVATCSIASPGGGNREWIAPCSSNCSVADGGQRSVTSHLLRGGRCSCYQLVTGRRVVGTQDFLGSFGHNPSGCVRVSGTEVEPQEHTF